MHSRILIYTILVALVALCQPVSAQVSKYNVIWLDSEQQKLAGDLEIELHPKPQEKLFELHFHIQWHDINGILISESGSKPLIYLSSSDIRILPQGEAFCKTFTKSDVFDIYFSDEKVLTFGFLADLNQELEVHFNFQYAYSQEEILNGNTYTLKSADGEKIVYRIPISSLTPVEIEEAKEIVNNVDPLVIDQCNKVDSCLLVLNTSTDFLLNEITISSFQDKITTIDSQISTIEKLDSASVVVFKSELITGLSESFEFLSRLDVLSKEATLVEKQLAIPIPADSINIFQTDLDNITRRIKGTKNDILNYRGQMRSLLSSIGEQIVPNDLAQHRELILSIFSPIFTSQFEYITRLNKQHEALLIDLDPILEDLPSKAIGSIEFDSLVRFHTIIIDSLEVSRIAHREDYKAYRDRIDEAETGPISDLDYIHESYQNSYNIVSQDIVSTQSEIDLFKRKIEEIKNKQDYTLLWIGGGVLVFLIFFLLIREIRLGRKRATPLVSNGKKAEFDLDEELANTGLYYPFTVPAEIESVVKEVHFSFSAIKSINQIVQGAISNKTALSFGGYLFGYQYKAQGDGAGMYIVMVDHVVVSKTLRKDFVSGVNTNEDIVDEIDRVIGENKNKTLLGWFTSTDDEEYIMPESLIKVHRTFFRDRWQTALLINPFTSDLNSSIYLRRKSGYFDPKANANCYIKMEELHQYSQNPPIQSEDLDEYIPDLNEFVKIDVSGRWCDSIVKSVFFRKDVIESMDKELHDDRMKLTNHEASGYMYGRVIKEASVSNGREFNIYINRYVDASNGEAPRDLPGFNLLGWIGLNDKEILESLKTAVPYHSRHFRRSFQVAVIVNTSTLEMRIFSKKHSFELNNNTIETEEFSFNNLLKPE